MKTLDVQEFHNGLDQTLTELKKQEKDITKIKSKPLMESLLLMMP
ncbi:hypothetical protein [Bacillus changyiensis]